MKKILDLLVVVAIGHAVYGCLSFCRALGKELVHLRKTRHLAK